MSLDGHCMVRLIPVMTVSLRNTPPSAKQVQPLAGQAAQTWPHRSYLRCSLHSAHGKFAKATPPATGKWNDW
eukprot:s396_g7.t1